MSTTTYMIMATRTCSMRSASYIYNVPDEKAVSNFTPWRKDKPSSGVSLNVVYTALQKYTKAKCACEYEIVEV